MKISEKVPLRFYPLKCTMFNLRANKTKLGNTEAHGALESIVSENLQTYLEDIDHQQTLKVIWKSLEGSKVREAARRQKKLPKEEQSGRCTPVENWPAVQDATQR